MARGGSLGSGRAEFRSSLLTQSFLADLGPVAVAQPKLEKGESFMPPRAPWRKEGWNENAGDR